MIPESTVRDILETAKVEDVIAEFVSLKKRGANLLGLCPFHGERTPSFTVSPSKNIYKCFGCGRAGDSVTFLKEHEQMTYPEALRYLAQKYGIEIEEEQRSEQAQLEYDHRTWLLGVLDFAAKHYHQSLTSGAGRAIGQSYFTNRGLLQKTIETFQLGYADSQQALSSALEKMGYTADQLQDAGLLNRGNRDFFYDRAIFPIQNLSGRVIALAGRIIGDKKGPKYINSADSPIYEKSKVLYGLYQAKSEIRKADKCYLAEGYMDVLSLHQNGFPQAIATCGTALTAAHAKLIKRFTKSVVMLFDGDQAGQQATMKAVRHMLAEDVNVYIVAFPAGEDPDSMVNAMGHTAFEDYMQTSEVDFIQYYAQLKLKEAPDDPVKRTEFVEDIIALIALIPNEIKQAAYVQQLSGLIGLSEELLAGQLAKAVRQEQFERQRERQRAHRTAQANQPEESSLKKDSGIDPFIHEKEVIRVLLLGGDKILEKAGEITVRDFVLEQLKDIPHLLHPDYEKIFQEVRKLSDSDFDPSFFQHHPDEAVRAVMLALEAAEITISPNWAEKWDIHLQTQPAPEDNFYAMSQQAVLRLQLDRLQQMAEQNIEILGSLEDDDDIERHLAMQQKINDMKAGLSKQLGMIVLPT